MYNSKGYTLVELLAVIVIMGILAAIAAPVYGHFMDQYKEDLCEVNRVEMARLYGEFLDIEQVEHSSVAFTQFSLSMLDGDVCPVGGELTYVDGTVECSVHGDHESGDEEDEGNDDGGVPFL
ncbi:type II secretion system protein [Mesobacillus selenatarsenatis]|uniref:type II secretion system protein n=1 Tax=Mesobacillus selenatarsenatis TaxID=388741 RepID=UPI001AE0BD8C|nr:type II secretion system protein [Mesobacillus selenatarsenatis]